MVQFSAKKTKRERRDMAEDESDQKNEDATSDGAPTPELKWQVGRPKLSVTGEAVVTPPPEEVEETVPDRGWKRAVFDLEADIVRGEWPTLPEAIEKHAPVLNVLHTAGERALLRLPDGKEYILYGWPDLRRPNAKVLAIADGDPMAEVIALHRYPTMCGICVAGRDGMLLSRSHDVEKAGTQITGREPQKWDGTLFALQGDAIWIEHQGQIYKWDGRRETNDGSPKQVLASLVLQWSNR